MSCGPAPSRMAGISKGSTFSSWFRRKACSTKTSSRACFIPRTSNSAKRPSASSKRSKRSSPSGWCSTASPKSGSLRNRSLRYRRQILALKHYFARSGATVLMLDDLSSEAQDRTMHSVAHGVIRLEELSPEYGAERRRLRVVKYRGQRYRGGYHDFVIKPAVFAFSRVWSRGAPHERSRRRSWKASLPELNALLGGGIERGSSTLILGPAGTGKSLLGADLRRRRGQPRRARGDVRLRRGTRLVVRARQGARNRPSGYGRHRQACHRAESTPPNSRRENCRNAFALASRTTMRRRS